MTAHGDILVVGLGQPDRGDDAVGAVVAGIAQERHGNEVTVVAREDPTALIQLWDGYRAAIVIDAVASGGPPGAIHVRDAGAHAEPLPTHAFTAAGRGGSHAFGLAGAVELSRTLGTLPPVVVIVGIEAATFALGPMSGAVRAQLGAAADVVSDEIARVTWEVRKCA